MQNKTIPLFVSSDPTLGAINLTSGNDRFSVQFKRTIIIPEHAQNITLECNQANIWWTVLNVTLGVNDAFRLIEDGVGTHDIILEPGLYDISGLNSAVNNLLINEGLASGVLTITGDNSTQKVLLSFTIAGLQVEWVPTSFFELVGFNSGQLVPSGGFTIGAFSELAPNIANFSDISSFLVHTSLLQSGIPLGDTESQVLANPQINVPPGSLINFNPFNPVQLDVNHLRGQNINEASFWITDQLNRVIDFNGEFFTLLIVLRYHVLEPSHSNIYG